MISLNQLKSQLTEGLSYGSDKLYVIEIQKNGYWETYSYQAFASYKDAKALVRDLSTKPGHASPWRVVTYAPVGAN